MVGDKLKEFRKAKGLSQAKLGELVGVAGPSIARYESGQNLPSVDVATKISKVLEIPVSALMDVDLSVEEDEATMVAARISIKILDNPTLQKIAELLNDMTDEQLEKVASILMVLFDNPQD